MSKTKKAVSGLVGVIVVSAIAFTAYSWYSNRNLNKVSKLVDRLAVAGDLPTGERNALKLELMRTVDELPGDKVMDLYSQLKKKGSEHEKKKITEFASASDADKAALLDADLKRRKNQGEVWRALRSDGMPYSAWGRRKRGGKRDDRKKDDKPEISDEEKAERAEFNKQRGEYYKALKARAKELGMDDGDRRGRGRDRKKK